MGEGEKAKRTTGPVYQPVAATHAAELAMLARTKVGYENLRFALAA